MDAPWWPFPPPYVPVITGSEPLTGGWVQARFDATPLARGRYEVVVKDGATTLGNGTSTSAPCGSESAEQRIVRPRDPSPGPEPRRCVTIAGAPPAPAVAFAVPRIQLPRDHRALGGVLLSLPFAAAGGRHVSVLDAFFTSVSAVCVTGLIVVDTPVDLSVFGQVVVLVLIQAGGLGYMTLSTVFAVALGRSVTLQERMTLQEALNVHDMEGLVRFAGTVLKLTLAFELVGASVLALRWWSTLGFGQGGLARAVPRGVGVQQRRLRALEQQPDAVARRRRGQPGHHDAHHRRRPRASSCGRNCSAGAPGA